MKKILLLAFLLVSSITAAFSQLIINGNNVVPYGSSNTYVITKQDGTAYTGGGITWTVSGGTASITSSSGTAVTVNAGSPGAYRLTANVITSGCGNSLYIDVQVTGGSVLDTYKIVGPSGFCTNTGTNDYTLPVIQGATYQWSFNPSAYTSIGNNGSNVIWLNAAVAGSYSLDCIITTSTGQVIYVQETAVGVVQANHDGSCSVGIGGEQSSFIVSPNPGNNEISINTISNTNATATTTDAKFSYKVYDKVGKMVKSGNFSSLSKAVISTTNLPADNYFVHITSGSKVIKKQIIITH